MKASNIEELRRQLRECFDTGERIDRLTDFAYAHAQSKPLEGLEALDEARQLAREIDDRDRYATALVTTAICLETPGRYDEALVYLAEAEKEYYRTNNLNGLARCANTTGLNYRDCSRYPEAIEKFNRAIDLARETSNRLLLAAALNNLAGTYYLFSHYHKALEFFLEALRLYDEGDNVRNKAIIAENIGSIYYHLNDFDLALAYRLQSLEMTEQLDDPYGIAHILTNLSEVYKVKGEPDRARDALQRALDIFVDIGVRRFEGIVRIRLALLNEHDLEKKEHVLSELERGLTTLREVNVPNDYADAVVGMARVYANHGQPESAITLLNRELPTIEEAGGELIRSEAYELLARVYEMIGDLAQSLAFAKRFTDLKVKMMGEERQRIIAEMQARYDVGNAEREREIYRLRAEEIEKLAEERSRQLSVMAMQLLQKNNLLKQIDENLESLADRIALDPVGKDNGKEPIDGKGTGSIPEQRIDSIQNLIRSNLRSNEDWKRFEEIYNLVHNDFTQQIAARAPDLSPMELKVCALLHINLSNKEIADILYISVRTVESHRYRIRKKLGLSGTDNLASIISPSDLSS